MTRPRALLAALALAGAVTTTAAAMPVPIGPDLQRLGWRALAFSGAPPARFTGLADGTLMVETDAGVSLLYRALAAGDGGPCLAWSWRVDRSTVPATDLARKGGDDRPLMILVGFPDTAAGASLSARIGRLLHGGALPEGRVLAYVWGGREAGGRPFALPHMPVPSHARILRPADAPTRTWFAERIDLDADHRAAFGAPAPAPRYVAVAADSDDTATRSLARVAGLAFGADCARSNS